MDAHGSLTMLHRSRVQLLLLPAGVVVLAGALMVIAGAADREQKPGIAAAERSRFDNGLGYLTAAATPQNAGQARTRQPLTEVPLIAGTGACLAAMDSMRELMQAVPSGGLLPRAPGWAKLVSPRMGAVNASCTGDAAQAFRDHEVLPWNNAVIPEEVRIPPAPPS